MSLPSFIFGQGTPYKTPEQLQEARRRVRDLMSGGPEQYSRPGGWLYALSDGLGAALEQRKISQGEQYADEQRQKGSALFSQMMNGFGNAPAYPSSVAAGASPTSGVATGTAIASTPQAAEIKQGLEARGLPSHVADAFVMNFQDESGLNPGINEKNPIVPGSRGGYGLYQLTGPRRVAYEQFAQQRGVDPSNTDAQLDFLMTELQGSEARAAKSILSAPDTATAAQAIVNDFLRPAPEHRAARAAKYAKAGGVQVASLDPSIGITRAGGATIRAGDYGPSSFAGNAPADGARATFGGPQLTYDDRGLRFVDEGAQRVAAQSAPAVAPYDFTGNPQLSAGSGMRFQSGQPQQMAALPQQPASQAPTGPSAELLRQNDMAFGGALAPQGRAPQQVADASGYFPPAPSMDRAPVQPQAAPQNNNRLQLLGEVLSNPFVPEEQKRIAQMMFQQEMQQGQTMRQQQAARENWLFQQQYEEQVNARDPLRQAQIAKLQREAANPKGDETFFGNPVPIQNADGSISYGQIGNKGSFKPIQLNEGQTFAPPTKTIDTGTEIILTDQAGNVISRTSKQNYQAENDKARGASDGKNASEALASLPGTESFATSIDKQIDDLKNDPYLDKMLGWNDWLPNVYPDAKRVQSKIDQLKGGAFIAAREWLKGQGPITDFESARAEAAYARLSTAQSPEDFRLALEDFRNAVRSGADKVRARVKLTGGQQQSAPVSTQQPTSGGGSTRSGLKWSIEP